MFLIFSQFVFGYLRMSDLCLFPHNKKKNNNNKKKKKIANSPLFLEFWHVDYHANTQHAKPKQTTREARQGPWKDTQNTN